MPAHFTLRHVIGAFRVIRRRSHEVGQSGLATWSDAGESAALAVSTTVRDTAHRGELRALSLAEEIKAMVADGEITAVEMGRLRLVSDSARRIADDCHALGEVVS